MVDIDGTASTLFKFSKVMYITISRYIRKIIFIYTSFLYTDKIRFGIFILKVVEEFGKVGSKTVSIPANDLSI